MVAVHMNSIGGDGMAAVVMDDVRVIAMANHIVVMGAVGDDDCRGVAVPAPAPVAMTILMRVTMPVMLRTHVNAHVAAENRRADVRRGPSRSDGRNEANHGSRGERIKSLEHESAP